MSARLIFILSAALFISSSIAAEDDCTAALAEAAREKSALSAKLLAEQDRIQVLKRSLEEKEETFSKERNTLSDQLRNEKDRVQVLTAVLKEKEDELVKLSSKRPSSDDSQSRFEEELKKKTTECQTFKSELKISQGAEKQMKKELAKSFARVDVLAAEKNQLQKLTTELKEELASSRQNEAKSAEELKTKTTECQTFKSELKISQGAEKQLKKELAKSFARVDLLAAEKNQLQKLADELKAASSEENVSEEQLKQKTAESKKCESELRVSQGAEKQMKVELANSFARVKILAAETEQLTTLADDLKAKVTETEKITAAAINRAAEAEAEAASLRVQINQSGGQSSITIDQIIDATREQLAKLSPYWLSIKEACRPAWTAFVSAPIVASLMETCQEAINTVIEFMTSLMAKASPYFAEAYQIYQKYTELAIERVNAVYITTKPVLTQGWQTIQEYGTLGRSAVEQGFRVSTQSISRFYHQTVNSAFVVEVQRLSSETVSEIKGFIQTQMQLSNVLHPFAKEEYVIWIVYSLLAIPPLFILTLFLTCFGRSAPKKPPTVVATGQKKSKPGQKKGRKGKVVTVGGDVVKFGA